MSLFSFQEILDATEGVLLNGSVKGSVKGVSIDTRTIQKGDLFVAIHGDRLDGHAFIAKALHLGAGAVMISDEKIVVNSNVPVIRVGDTTRALGNMAAYHRQRFSLPVVAITGSAGKTTTKEFIAGVLKLKGLVLSNERSFNNHIGVPLTLLRLRATHKVCVLELGTSGKGEIDYLAAMVKPTVAVFTNIGASHLEGLGSLSGVYREKMSLLKHLDSQGHIIFNQDDIWLKKLLKKDMTQKKWTYSIDADSNMRVWALKYRQGGLDVFLNNDQSLRIVPGVWGNVYNALAAVICGEIFRIPFEKIAQSIMKNRPVSGRQVVHKVRGFTIIDDTYNANPVSFTNALKTLSLMPIKGRLFIVAGDMLELGAAARKFHQQIGRLMSHLPLHSFLAVGPLAKVMACEVKKNKDANVKSFDCVEDLIEALHATPLQKGDVLLIKASRAMHLEKVLEILI